MNFNYEAQQKKNKRIRLLKAAAIWLVQIIVVVALAFGAVHLTLRKCVTLGSNMAPTIESGEKVYVFTKAYSLASPKREDIIAFYDSEGITGAKEEPNILFRRVMGLPGETVKIQDGKVFINGAEAKLKYKYESADYQGAAAQDIKLGEDEYFVLCDKRTDTDDSRSEEFGLVAKSRIIGRVVIRDKGFSLINNPERE